MGKKIFTPPIEKRETMELIGIANCTDDTWQEEAKNQAELELNKRNVTKEYQQEIVNEWNEEIKEFKRQQEKIFKENELNEYSFLDQLIIFILSPLILLGKVRYDKRFTDLKNENYKKKMIQRRNALILGTFCYLMAFYLLIEYK